MEEIVEVVEEGRMKSRRGYASDKRCPKCGSTLLTNDYGQVWCSYIGGSGARPCNYGITHDNDCASKYVRAESHGGGFYSCDCGYVEAVRDKA